MSDDELPWSEDDVSVRRARIEPGPGDADDQDDELVTDGGIQRVELEEPSPDARRIKAALLDDDTLDELASVRHALRNVDVEDLEDDAAAAFESARDSFDEAWREQFDSTLDCLQLDIQPCPPSP